MERKEGRKEVKKDGRKEDRKKGSRGRKEVNEVKEEREGGRKEAK